MPLMNRAGGVRRGEHARLATVFAVATKAQRKHNNIGVHVAAFQFCCWALHITSFWHCPPP